MKKETKEEDMVRRKYTKSFRKKVVEEALRPEMEGKEFLVAEKYNIRPSTVCRWMDLYLKYGETALCDNAQQIYASQSKESRAYKKLETEKNKEIAELKEEVEILKKAAAFLTKIQRD